MKPVLSLRVQEKMILQTKFMRTNASKYLGRGKSSSSENCCRNSSCFLPEAGAGDARHLPHVRAAQPGEANNTNLHIPKSCKGNMHFPVFLPSSLRPECCPSALLCTGCCWSQRRLVSRPSQDARFDTESNNMEKPIFSASHNHLLLCTERQNVIFHQSGIVAFFSLLLIMESFRKQRTRAAGCQYTINLFSFIPSSFLNTTEEKQSAQC